MLLGSTEIGGAGGAGLSLDFGHAFVSGGSGNVFRGGDASTLSGLFGPTPGGVGAVGIGNLDYAQDVVFEGGLDSSGVQGPALIDDQFIVLIDQPFVRPTLSASAAQVAIGASFDLLHEGNASGTAVVLYSLSTGPFLDVPGIDGPLVVDLASAVAAAGFTLDGTGLGTATLGVPSLPALSGLTVTFQSFEANGTLQALSNPAVVAIEP